MEVQIKDLTPLLALDRPARPNLAGVRYRNDTWETRIATAGPH